MTSVEEGSDTQPATSHESAMVSDTMDEEALPHSQPGIKRIKPRTIKLDESLCLNDTNWAAWRVRMANIFRVCGVEGYVNGTLLCPDYNVDPEGARNWSFNDIYTQMIISLNMTRPQRKKTWMCDNAHEEWAILEVANRSQASGTSFAYMRKLFHTTTGERDNIIEHLGELKKYRLQTNFAALSDERLKISDGLFNLIIAQSLPPSWNNFTGSYVVTWTKGDPGTMISSERFMEAIEQEYRRREQLNHECLARRPTHIPTYVGHQPSCYS